MLCDRLNLRFSYYFPPDLNTRMRHFHQVLDRLHHQLFGTVNYCILRHSSVEGQLQMDPGKEEPGTRWQTPTSAVRSETLTAAQHFSSLISFVAQDSPISALWRHFLWPHISSCMDNEVRISEQGNMGRSSHTYHQ